MLANLSQIPNLKQQSFRSELFNNDLTIYVIVTFRPDYGQHGQVIIEPPMFVEYTDTILLSSVCT